MPYPNMPGKYKDPALITADLDSKHKLFGDYPSWPLLNPELPVPHTMVLTYGQFAKETVKSNKCWKYLDFHNDPLYVLNPDALGHKTGLVEFSFYGADMTALRMEELIKVGVKDFIIAGWAGALQTGLHIGDIVVCNKAIRDEGVSHHYLEPGKYVEADKTLVQELLASTIKSKIPTRVAPTYTTCAPLRTTAKEVKAYSGEGVVTVEMEAAAAFALAEHFTRKGMDIRAGAVFVISDSLAKLRWRPSANLPFNELSTVLQIASKGELANCNETKDPRDGQTAQSLENMIGLN